VDKENVYNEEIYQIYPTKVRIHLSRIKLKTTKLAGYVTRVQTQEMPKGKSLYMP